MVVLKQRPSTLPSFYFGEVADGPGECTPKGWAYIIEYDSNCNDEDRPYQVIKTLKVSLRLHQ